MDLRNEYAHVHVELDNSGNGPRLLIRDERRGREIYLDPLELQTLAWCAHEDLKPFLDPNRWVDEWDEGLAAAIEGIRST